MPYKCPEDQLRVRKAHVALVLLEGGLDDAGPAAEEVLVGVPPTVSVHVHRRRVRLPVRRVRHLAVVLELAAAGRPTAVLVFV